MAERIREAVLRLPGDRIGFFSRKRLAEEYGDLAGGKIPGFRIASTVRPFVEYVLASEETDADADTVARALTEEEREAYTPVFIRLFPQAEMKDVRYVEYVRPAGADAPEDYLPYLFRRVTVRDVISLQRDRDFAETLYGIERDLGETGRILIRFSGIAPENKVFIEAPEKGQCEKALDDLVRFLDRKGYLG